MNITRSVGRPHLPKAPEAVLARQEHKHRKGKLCKGCNRKKPPKEFYSNGFGYLLPNCKSCDKSSAVRRVRLLRYSGPEGLQRLDDQIKRVQKELAELQGMRSELTGK